MITTPNIQYKILTTRDYDSYYALRLESLQKSPEMYATDANDWQNAPREVIEKHLIYSESGESPIFGAWDGDKLVGQAGLQPDRRPTVQHKATIWGVFITPEYRCQGIGSTLIKTAVAAARENDTLMQLRAVVNASNPDAVSLFQRVGFQEFGREPRAKYFHHQYQDQIFFWYPLDNED